jgi:hypothetical protein
MVLAVPCLISMVAGFRFAFPDANPGHVLAGSLVGWIGTLAGKPG